MKLHRWQHKLVVQRDIGKFIEARWQGDKDLISLRLELCMGLPPDRTKGQPTRLYISPRRNRKGFWMRPYPRPGVEGNISILYYPPAKEL